MLGSIPLPRPYSGLLLPAAVAAATATLTAVAGLGTAVPSAQAQLAATGAPASSSSGLFPEAPPREVRAHRSRASAEVGTRFTPRRDGVVTAAQVYKATGAERTTPTKATLWGARGKRLATTRITPTANRGWITVSFPEAVRVTADKTYTVSVFAPRGRVAITRDGFDSRISRKGLTAPKDGGARRTTSRSAFPDHRSGHNYWVDVVFERSASGTTTGTTGTTGTSTTSGTPPTVPSVPGTTPSAPGTPTFPTAAQTGVPDGWNPATTYSGTYRVTTPGAVVQDLRVNGSIVVDAPNVTLRRVEVIGGGINNFAGSSCQNGLVIEDSTVRRSTSQTTDEGSPAVGAGGYTARRVEIDGLPEGFRVGGLSSGCGPVTIEGSYARIVRPDVCGDWHGDGIQGYDGPALTLRNTTLELVENGCGGTAPFFYPKDQGNASVDIDGLLVSGGGFAFRLGTPGTVRNLAVANGSYTYGPINVACSALSGWDARIVNVNAAGALTTVRSQACNTEEGN